MNRLLVLSSALTEEVPELSQEARRHMKVWRLKDTEPVELFDGAGRTRLYAYQAADQHLHAQEDGVVHPAPCGSLTLFACVTKGSRWDWTIEKATELGATRIVPVLSERTIVRIETPKDAAAKMERWQKIVEEAARQSDAVYLPRVLAPVTFAGSLPLVKKTTCLIGALTMPPPKGIATVADELRRAALKPLDWAVFIGPEGDFTPAELSTLLAIAHPVSLGPRILRAETAAIFSLSVLAAQRF